jgi:hypothetical protein
MLRTVLLCLGTVSLIGGVIVSVCTHSPAGAGPIGIGLILLLSPLIERYRYKRVLDDPPGTDWQPTGERFIEPGTDVSVTVYSQPATGKRVYVRMHAR